MARSDMSSERNYETLYGVGLLDDLHNYFPALLYDSSSFSNVQQVLNYVQTQTRNRFDLFSLGRREYQSSHPSVAVAPGVSHQMGGSSSGPIPRNVPSVRPTTSAAASSLLTPLTPSSLQQSATEILEELATQQDTRDFTSRLLLELLQSMPPTTTPARRPMTTLTPLFTIPLTNTGLEAFLEPVVVRPTPEQIAQSTTVANLASDTDHTCSICEDTIQPEEEARKLNACGHWFHRNCIDEWLNRSVLCPNCRHDIRVPSTAARSRQNSVTSPPNP